MKQNRTDWKAKSYMKEYDAKIVKHSEREIYGERRERECKKTIAYAQRCQKEVIGIVKASCEVFTLRSGVDARRDAIASISSRAKTIRRLLRNIEQTCEEEHLQRVKRGI